MQRHAYVIEGGVEEGIARAEDFIARALGMKVRGNADVIVLRYGLLSVEEARGVASIASSGAVAGESKAIIIAAGRAYHEAQNALLKIFEEPPKGAYLFLVIPSLGGLLPTLKSRVQVLGQAGPGGKESAAEMSGIALEFIKMSKEKRSALIKKLATGKDEEERRENRDEAIAIVNGIEAIAYRHLQKMPSDALFAFLSDIAILRSYLHAPSAPVRMILEHLSLTLPKLQ